MTGQHPRAGVEYPRNWHELLAWFPDDAACLRYLERLRWGAGFTCRFCGAVDRGWWQMGDGLRRCAACRSETSVTAGTIFAGTRTPLVSWFAAVWYVVNQKQGVSALGLQRVLGLGSYQTAWAWLHKLRRAMVLAGRELLAGAVEVDESYVGARRTGVGGRGAAGKAIVAIAVEGDQAPERVRMRRIPDVTKDTLTDFVLDHLARGSEVRTDGWQGYFDIGRYRFKHVVTNVSASGDPAHVVLPHVHLVSSLVKRWILGTHQGAISHAQLDYYLDEFTFRFNRRHSRHRGLLFYRLLEGAVATDPRTPTTALPVNRPHSQAPTRIGGPNRIASSWQSDRSAASGLNESQGVKDDMSRPAVRVVAVGLGAGGRPFASNDVG